MAKEFKLSMVLSARDAASKVITKLMRDSTKESQNAEKAQEKLGKRQRTTAEEGIRQNRALGEEVRRQNRARETLGIRAERAIQREIQQTIASYNRLARSGTLSIDEQSRAYERMRQRVSQLRVEMQGMNKLARVSDIAGSIAKIGGAVVAGGVAFSEPVKKQMTYEQQLLGMSNTAYESEGFEGRLQGAKELDALIRSSVSQYGGTKEDAAQALSGLLASGYFTGEDVKGLLPLIQQYSVAGNVSSADLASVAIALKRNYKVDTPEKLKRAFDMAMKSGQKGSVEFPDLAKWLSQLLAASNSLGMEGLEDLGILFSAIEAAPATAGSNDEAANNIKNLLLKLNSTDAANRAKQIKVDGYGIDLSGTLINARKNGINPIDAALGLTDKIAEANPEYKKLQQKLDSGGLDDAERQRTTMAMAKILEGSALGQLIADQQALMGLVALRSQRKYMLDVRKDIFQQMNAAPGEGEGDLSYKIMATGNQFKVQKAKEQSDFAEMDAVKPLSDSLGSLSEKFTDFSKEFPGLTTAVMGAKTGIEAMTQAAIAFAALKFLFGGEGVSGVPGGKNSPLPTGAGAGAKSSGLFGRWGSLVGWGMIATELATITSPEEDAAVMGSEERWASIRANYPQSMIDAAREKYQPWYQFGEGYSTENEEWLQRYTKDQEQANQAGIIAKDVVNQILGITGLPKFEGAINQDVITFDTLEKSGVLQPLLDLTQALKNPPPPPVIEVRSVVELDGQQVAESVNRVNGQDAGRTTGGMFP
ncbi:phage tail tape measure protein [Providencia stuartii]|uniref:phage tail tape measure protein n=1 Tax=Providencia stuartii TaxID=588 RepID=UPI00111EABAA|nr:phage tail tape measure protein [Providencia stuartii]